MITRLDQINDNTKQSIIKQIETIPLKDIVKSSNLNLQEIVGILTDNNIRLPKEDILSTKIRSNKLIIISDTHIGSELENLYYLDLLYDFAIRNNITKVIHGGDLLQSSIKPVSDKYKAPEKQLKHLIKEYPQSKKVTTYVTFGNHDLHIFTKFNEGLKMLKERKDIKPLGFRRTYIDWNDNILSICHECPKYRVTIPNLDTLINFHGHRHNIKINDKGGIYIPTLSDDLRSYTKKDLNDPAFLVAYIENNILYIEKYIIKQKVINKGLIYTKKI